MTESRRYLHVIHYPVFGGPHNQALQLAGPLRTAGWDGVVLLPDEAGNAARRLADAGVPVVTMRMGRLRASADPRAQLRYLAGVRGDIRRIRSFIKSRNPSLVLVGGLVNPQAAVAARLEGVPVIWQILDTRAPMALRHLLMPLVLRLAQVVMSTGTVVATEHPGTEKLDRRLVSYFPPVNTGLFRPDPKLREAARKALGLRCDDLVIGTVGNLNPMKGHATFVRAAGALKQSSPGTRFVILGANYVHRPTYVDELGREAERLGLKVGTDLIMRDPDGQVAALASAFDIFWLTSESRSEGIPTVIGEAMSIGLPVVATNVGGVSEAVCHGETGLLVEPQDPAELARATLMLVDDAPRRIAMGAAGRERARSTFDVTVCTETHVRAFEVATSGADGEQ